MTTNESVVVGVFKDRSQAERAVEALQQTGFSDDQILFAGHGPSTGGILDRLKSLFAGREPVSGSVVNDLISLGVPEEDADYYQREYEVGRYIIMVTTDGRRQETIKLLADYGGFGARKPAAQTGDYASTGGTFEQSGVTDSEDVQHP